MIILCIRFRAAADQQQPAPVIGGEQQQPAAKPQIFGVPLQVEERPHCSKIILILLSGGQKVCEAYCGEAGTTECGAGEGGSGGGDIKGVIRGVGQQGH